jgi:hypothetical protein
MESKISLDKQGKDEIKNLFNWIKKSKVNDNSNNQKTNMHCNNFSSHCCLDCDRCWGGKYKK